MPARAERVATRAATVSAAPSGAPLRTHAYSNFTERLLARDIEPGQIVSQRELVALTGMPLGAIREMIPRLEADGLIRTVPKRGLQVLAVDLALIRDAFQLRRLLEGEAFACYAKTGPAAEIRAFTEAHLDIADQARRGVDADLLERAQRLDWSLHDADGHRGVRMLVADLNRLYAGEPALHRGDSDADGIRWVVDDDAHNSVYAWLRLDPDRTDRPVLVIVNATPTVLHDYTLGVPTGGAWTELLSTDADVYGGSDAGNPGAIIASANGSHGFDHSISVTLPPLGAIFLAPAQANDD